MYGNSQNENQGLDSQSFNGNSPYPHISEGDHNESGVFGNKPQVPNSANTHDMMDDPNIKLGL